MCVEKVCAFSSISARFGITTMCVGKKDQPKAYDSVLKDNPNVRGKSCAAFLLDRIYQDNPHACGKGLLRLGYNSTDRITPMCVGKRVSFYVIFMLFQNSFCRKFQNSYRPKVATQLQYLCQYRHQ